MEHKAFMANMIQTELEDVVGVDNASVSISDRAVYGVDYFWLSRMPGGSRADPSHAGHHRTPGCAEKFQDFKDCQLL